MNSPRRLRLDLSYYYRLPSVQVSLGVVLAFFIIAFFVMFAIRPTFATIVKLQRDITESKKTLVLLETKVKALDSAAQLLDKIKPSLPKLESSIPGSSINYGELSRSLEVLAQQTGVVLDNFTLGQGILMSQLVAPYLPNKNQETIELPITIKVTGTYPNCSNFLTRVNNNVRLTNIDSLTLAKDGTAKKGSNEAGLTMTLSGKVYYMGDNAAIKKIFPEEKGKK